MPSFYLKQQEEVNTWSVSVFCAAAAPVISWNRKRSHYYMKHLNSVRPRTLNPQPEIRLVLWHLMCRKHQSGEFIRPASSRIQTNKPYLQEACRSKATHAPPLSSHSPSTDDFTRGLGPHLCTDKTSKQIYLTVYTCLVSTYYQKGTSRGCPGVFRSPAGSEGS